MKKFMFSALACVAFAFSGFASNEEVESKEIEKGFDIEQTSPSSRICKYTVYVTDSEGISCEFSGTANDGKPINPADCGRYSSGFVKSLEQQGFTIDKIVTTLE